MHDMRNFYNMYIRCLKRKIEKELSKRPQDIEILGEYKDEFINWCAIQRYSYEADLTDELNEFMENLTSKSSRLDGTLWKMLKQKIFKRDNYTCIYCGKVGGELQVDHIIPISRGGGNDMSNLVTACQHCNIQKKDKTVIEFLHLKKSEIMSR